MDSLPTTLEREVILSSTLFLLFISIESCPGASAEFEGREGIFIQGEITPPFADVSVTIKLLAEGDSQQEKTIDVLTDNRGAYRFVHIS